MASFRQVLTYNEEELLKLFYIFHSRGKESYGDLRSIARDLKLKPEQLTCALGFNHYISRLTELLPAIGYTDLPSLIYDRNEIYTHDVYRYVSLNNILTLYGYIKAFPDTLEEMQSLVTQRVEIIEEKIENTVNSVVIDKYKEEMRSIYLDGIADIAFAEKRLGQYESGFRAMINEVFIITESKLIPAGDIFFRNTVLPEEKRKLLNKGMIPRDLIESRLNDGDVSEREKTMLKDFLMLNDRNDK